MVSLRASARSTWLGLGVGLGLGSQSRLGLASAVRVSLGALDRADHRRQEGQRLLLQGGLHPLQVGRDGAEERLEG